MASDSQTEMWAAEASIGDRLALAKLLAMHHPSLAARAAAHLDPNVGARTSPEDVLQEVYLQVFREVEHFEWRGTQSFLNWVLTILDHKLVDVHRAAHRARRDVARELPPEAQLQTNSYWNLLDQVYRDTATPSRIVRREESLAALMACVAQLPETQRRVIELRFLEGLPIAAVARQLGKSDEAVVALTQRAFQTLRAALERGEGPPRPL